MTDNHSLPQNMVELLNMRAEQHDNQDKIFFLNAELDIEERINYKTLMLRAKAIASLIQKQTTPGDRVLLIYPPGLEFICAFYACLYAGVIAVPVYPPADKKLVDKLQAVINNCTPAIILSTKTVVDQINKLKYVKALQNITFVNYMLSYFKNTQELTQWDFDKFLWVNTESLSTELADDYQKTTIKPNQIAFLQYTSGSTGQPKGVMVTHENLLSNMQVIHECYPAKTNATAIIWLPPYHDMGLIGGIMYPIFASMNVYLMSPITFLRNPLNWLKAIHRYKGTVTSAPNFAYALCCRKISTDQLKQIDLSHMDSFLNGAEPISQKVIEEFTAKFSICGFKKDMFLPCYGLAESTLMVTGQRSITTKHYRKEELRSHQLIMATTEDDAIALVSCGVVSDDLRIVDPKTLKKCSDETIGEIWLSSPNIAHGYWNQPEETALAFKAAISDEAGKHYLRTGDLGFISDKKLFVMGRNKDLIIINGTNHYPHDIEASIENCHPLIRKGACAAFSISDEYQEHLAIMLEVNKNCSENDANAIMAAIREITLEDHSLPVSKIALIPPRKLPKTTSGKIRRSIAKAGLVNKQIETLFEWNKLDMDMTLTYPQEKQLASPDSKEPIPELADLRQQIAKELGDILSIDPQHIPDDKHFAELGLDSLMAVELESRLQNHLKKVCNLPEIAVMNYPTVNALIEHIELLLTTKQEEVKQHEEKPFHFIDIPSRISKPRNTELSSLLDTGLGLIATEQLLAMSADYIDIIKLGFGTARLYPEKIIREKIRLLKSANIHVCPGGTFFEIARMQNKIDLYFQECLRLGFNCIELSDGVNGIPLEEKIVLIKQAREYGFTVLAEVGRKDPLQDSNLTIADRLNEIEVQLHAGAWKIILEARESGTTGLFNQDTSIKTADFDVLIKNANTSDLIFEAPIKHQQSWLINHLGANVNIGNIAPNDVMALEALRRSLRADTVALNILKDKDH